MSRGDTEKRCLVESLIIAMIMARHVLYAYVLGEVDDALVRSLEPRLVGLMKARKWVCGEPWLVDQIHEDTEFKEEGDAPDRDFGINIELPDPHDVRPGWFDEIEFLARALVEINSETRVEFAIGIGSNETGISEDLVYIDSDSFDPAELRAFLTGEPT